MVKVTHYAVYIIFRAVVGFFNIMPMGIAMEFGALFGRLLGSVPCVRRDMVFSNMKRALDLKYNDAELWSLLKSFYRNVGIMFAEYARIPTLSADNIDQYVSFEGLEHFDEALKKGRGVIILTGHIGNWELAGAALSLKGYKSKIIARPLNNPYLNEFVLRQREVFGSEIIDRDSAIKKVLGELKGNGIVGILFDQRPPNKDAVDVDFFGLTAPTTKVLAALAMKTGAAVIPAFLIRVAPFRFKLVVKAPVELVRGYAKERSIKENTQRFTKEIESVVAKHPEQWLWFHSRWRRVRRYGALSKFRDLTVYLFLRLLSTPISLLSEKAALSYASRLIALAVKIPFKPIVQLRENLKIIFGNVMNEEELDELFHTVFRQTSVSLVELLRLRTLKKEVLADYVSFEGLEHYERALKKGFGVIALSAHFGNWELMSAALSSKGYETSVFFRETRNPYIDAFIRRWRHGFGVDTIPERPHSLKKILSRLRANEVVIDLWDKRSLNPNYVNADLLGFPVRTRNGLAALAMRTGVVVIPTFLVREAPFKHRLVCRPPVEIIKTGDYKADLLANTQRFNAELEKALREHPDLWLCTHNRWVKSKLKGFN
jgi:KDO2-lipid IV(A) lauroyltransferase